jgi:hypothetical protein
MAQVTLNPSANTWFHEGDSVNHSTDTELRTVYGSNDTDAGEAGAIFQFTIPSNLRYKRFTKAVVWTYTTAYISGRVETSPLYKGMKACAYVVPGNTLNLVTGANIDTYGQRGEIILVEPWSTGYDSSYVYPKWRSADVTSIFRSNVVDNTYFTVILYGGPARSYDPDWWLNLMDGIGASHPAELVLTYEDVEQLPPTPSYPSGISINENTDILFAWAWNSSTSAVQASVQLEYKLKSAADYTVLSLTQSAHTYNLAGGLPQGSYQWRIKGTNDAGESSGYSEIAEFNVVGKPAAPYINDVPNRALTEIAWNTTDQNAYDITITDANGKVLIDESVASAESSYKPNIFLKGTYTVGIRTRNSTGLVSDWSYKTFSITAAGPAKPTIRLLQDDAQVKIMTTVTSGISYVVVRKEDVDGAPEIIIGNVDSVGLIDSTFGFGIPYRYVVRAYSTGGYTDSDPERICYPKTAIVLETSTDEIVIDKSEDKFLPFSEDVTAGNVAVYNCVGRDLPIAEHDKSEAREFRSRLYVREDQKERLVKMAKENRIFYRDYSGRAFSVVIQPPINFTRHFNDGYMADMIFIRIAEPEVIVNV